MSIELRNVTRRVGAETHIYETSLALEEGRFNCLLGTTLSGKTTLMRSITGVLRNGPGMVRHKGTEIGALPADTMMW